MKTLKSGIFVIAPLQGAVAERVREIQERYDPKLARHSPPHVTLAGSSGTGVILPDTPAAELRAALEPIAAGTPPLRLRFGPAMRFMQTDIISLPLDPHGPLRTLHERIATSGLRFQPARFAFTPHCTLNFYRTLTPQAVRELLAVRIPDDVLIDRLVAYHTQEPQPPRRLVEVVLRGAAEENNVEAASRSDRSTQP